MQKCATNELVFTTVNRKKVVAVFDDPQVTSDAGVLVDKLGVEGQDAETKGEGGVEKNVFEYNMRIYLHIAGPYDMVMP